MLSLLTRGNHGVRSEAIVNEFVDVSFDQLAVDDPGLFQEYIAVCVALGGFEENIPWRAPLARIAGKLAVRIMRGFVAVLARLGFTNYGIRRARRTKISFHVIAGSVFADAHDFETLRLV